MTGRPYINSRGLVEERGCWNGRGVKRLLDTATPPPQATRRRRISKPLIGSETDRSKRSRWGGVD
jgi:hypothetical protein